MNENRLELAATVLLAVAAVATAWSTYQSTRWRGEQAAQYSKGTAARIKSSQQATLAGQKTQIDIALFSQWVNAYASGETKLAAFYRQRFRPEFRPAFAAWLAARPLRNPGAPSSPFAMPQYHVAEQAASDRLNAQAGVHSDAAGTANENADHYVLAVVLLASALFFAGISTKLRVLRLREILLGLGWLLCLGTIVWLATSPLN